MQVDVTGDAEVSFSRPRPLFEVDIDHGNYRGLAPSQEDSRFLTVRLADESQEGGVHHISIIENWYEPFRKSSPG